MTAADLPALVLSALALITSLLAAQRQLRIARHVNSLPVLVDLFREHREARLTEGRHFVFNHLGHFDLTLGLDGLPEDKRVLVRDLTWYYDNLGALVAHGVVDLEPVSGYLGGTVTVMFDRLRPLIDAEPLRRRDFIDPGRWQEYFENLYILVLENPPAAARASELGGFRAIVRCRHSHRDATKRMRPPGAQGRCRPSDLDIGGDAKVFHLRPASEFRLGARRRHSSSRRKLHGIV